MSTLKEFFYIETPAAIGYLYKEKEKRIKDLKKAYFGILGILSKYLESADKYTKGHSVRVAHLHPRVVKAFKEMLMTEEKYRNEKREASNGELFENRIMERYEIGENHKRAII